MNDATEAAQRLRGILLMISAFALFAALDATAKFLSDYFPASQIIFARYTGAAIYALVFLHAIGALGQIRARNLKLQLLRGSLLFTSTAFNFFAVRELQLAQTSSIMFSNPLWVCALSVPLLGERVGRRRWMAVLIGFAGVMIIIRPGMEGYQFAALYSVGAALSAALYQIATRRGARDDSALTALFYTNIVGAFAATGLAPVMPGEWIMPQGFLIVLLLAMGLFGMLGHHLLVHAHRLAPAAVLAPFVYSQILWMVALGYIIFNDLPDRWTVLGGAVVVASGLYLYYREEQVKRRTTISPS